MSISKCFIYVIFVFYIVIRKQGDLISLFLKCIYKNKINVIFLLRL